VAVWRSFPTTLTTGDEPTQITRLDASANVFQVLGRSAALGRTFSPDEGLPGDRVGVLTAAMWERHFAANPDVIGRSIEVAGRAVTIIGVMPRDFEFLPADIGLVVANTFALERASRTRSPVSAVLSLPPDVTRDQARAQADAAWNRLQTEHPDALERYDFRVETLREQFPGESDTRLVQVTLLVALFVLLIAATNVASMLLARAEERRGEIALRMSLGAGHLRLLRQLLTESVVLAALSGVLGIALAWFSIGQLAGIWPPEIPDAFRPRAHPSVLGFSVLASFAIGIFFGLAPALQALRTSGQRDGLEEASRRGSRGHRRGHVRTAFVIGQIAIAIALLTGAGAMTQLTRSIVDVELGLNSERLLTFRTTASGARYDPPGTLARFHRDMEEALLALPGATGVAAMDELPRGRLIPQRQFTIDGRDTGDDGRLPETQMLSVNQAYFRTMEIPLREGRSFEASDRLGAAPVAVVSRTFAELHFPGERALGRRITLDGASREIVGIAEDVFHSRVELPGGLAGLAYLPMEQHPVRDVAFAVRTTGDPLVLASELRSTVRAVDPLAAVDAVQTLDTFIEREMAAVRVMGITMAIFAFLALALSAMGTYGVMAHGVARRSRELGIRIALGAGRASVVGLVLRTGIAQAAIGIAIGLPLGLMIQGATRGIGAQFRADVGGASTVVGVAVALAVVCLIASFLPATRASRIDPIKSLRADA
jgi:predicted permease